jgi:hypothetical protein
MSIAGCATDVVNADANVSFLVAAIDFMCLRRR